MWYYNFQDPSRRFLTYEEGRYFLTIQISGRIFFFTYEEGKYFFEVARAEIFIFHHDWADIFYWANMRADTIRYIYSTKSIYNVALMCTYKQNKLTWKYNVMLDVQVPHSHYVMYVAVYLWHLYIWLLTGAVSAMRRPRRIVCNDSWENRHWSAWWHCRFLISTYKVSLGFYWMIL